MYFQCFVFLLQCFDDILSKSEEKSGMLNVLIHRICVQVSEDADGMLSLIGLMPCIAKALAFGPINDKAKRCLGLSFIHSGYFYST